MVVVCARMPTQRDRRRGDRSPRLVASREASRLTGRIPPFKARHRDRNRVRFTTGAMRRKPTAAASPCGHRDTSSKGEPGGWSGCSPRGAPGCSRCPQRHGGRLFVSVARASLTASSSERSHDRCRGLPCIGAEGAVAPTPTHHRTHKPIRALAAVQQQRAAASPGRCHAASSDQGGTDRRSQLAVLDDARPICAGGHSHVTTGWHAATAPSWSRTGVSAMGKGHGSRRSGAASPGRPLGQVSLPRLQDGGQGGQLVVVKWLA